MSPHAIRVMFVTMPRTAYDDGAADADMLLR